MSLYEIVGKCLKKRNEKDYDTQRLIVNVHFNSPVRKIYPIFKPHVDDFKCLIMSFVKIDDLDWGFLNTRQKDK